jgi:FkbM family methyltransferase
MRSLLIAIRNKYHPLFYLRKYHFFQRLTALFNIPVAIAFPDIPHRVFVSLSRNLAWVISQGSAGEERERSNFAQLLRRGCFESFFDVGANVGVYGFMFRGLVPKGSVTMFEPDPDNATLIRRTLAQQDFSNVRLFEVAASDGAGSVSFLKDELSGSTGAISNGGRIGESFVERHHGAAPRDICVQCITLDDAASIVGDPDFVKIDVEGAEAAVFEGAQSLVARAKPAIFFECDSDVAKTAVLRFLGNAGYVVLDFESLRPVDRLGHNNLALHSVKHKAIIDEVRSMNQQALN